MPWTGARVWIEALAVPTRDLGGGQWRPEVDAGCGCRGSVLITGCGEGDDPYRNAVRDKRAPEVSVAVRENDGDSVADITYDVSKPTTSGLVLPRCEEPRRSSRPSRRAPGRPRKRWTTARLLRACPSTPKTTHTAGQGRTPTAYPTWTAMLPSNVIVVCNMGGVPSCCCGGRCLWPGGASWPCPSNSPPFSAARRGSVSSPVCRDRANKSGRNKQA